MLLTLYDQYGSVKATLSPNDTSTQDKEVQGDNVLNLSFTLYEYVGIDVNDYVDFEGERYWAVEKYLPNEKSTIEWEFNLKLYGIESLIKRFLVLNTVDGSAEAVFTLTAHPIEHMRLIVQNINDGMDHTTNFKVGTVEGSDNVVIDYTGKYCDEGLKELAEKVGVEWWIEGETVNLCRCEHGEELTLGYGNGLTSLDRDVADNAKFYTRLFPIGSSRNIDPERYGASRLQLPGGVKYVDVNADRYGIIHHYEQEAFSGIYPRRIGVVSSVRSENVQDSDGKPFTIYYFKDNDIPFDPNDHEIGGLVKHVSFQEGSELAGLGTDNDHYFEVNYNSETREFEIITIWPYDDDTQLPGGTLVPKAGDRYILWNIIMPNEYYWSAEQEFLSAVNEYNAKHSLDVSRYKAPTDHVWIEDEGEELFIGRRVRLESQEFFPDTGYRSSRITRICRQVTLPSQMDLEISDALSTRTLEKIDDAITDVKNYTGTLIGSMNVPDIIRSWDTTHPTDNNLYSARRSHKEFLSKNTVDRAKKKIIFDEGIEFGTFEGGVSGGSVYRDDDGNWHLETDYLDVRRKFSAREIDIQKVRHAGGQILLTATNMSCIYVEEDGTGWKCYFLATDSDGNTIQNLWAVGDQAYVQTFNLNAQAGGVGNHFLWRRVDGKGTVNALPNGDAGLYHYIHLSGSDCAEGSDEPRVGDSIVQLGHRGNDAVRQSAILIEGAGSGAPCIDEYAGINSFSLANRLESRIKPGSNILSGRMIVKNGSTGIGNFSDLSEEISNAVQVGAENILRNSGFDGEHESRDLAADTHVVGTMEFFSPRMEFWEGDSESVETSLSASGYGVRVVTELLQKVGLIKGEHYVLGFGTNGEGQSFDVSCGAFSSSFIADGERKAFFFEASSSSATFAIKSASNGSSIIYDLKLERGTVATDWSPSSKDTDPVADKFKELWYIQQAIKDGNAQILGGLILSSIINLGQWENGEMRKVTAGMSGVYNDDDDIAFWGGGDFESAIRAVSMFRNNPGYIPTESELNSIAKVVFTHGGRGILNDIVLRGYVYALGGVFRGKVYAEDGVFSGTIMARNGNFSGFLQKTALHINEDNRDEFMPEQSGGQRRIRFSEAGCFLIFDAGWGAGSTAAGVNIEFPSCEYSSSGVSYGDLQEALSYIGNQVILIINDNTFGVRIDGRFSSSLTPTSQDIESSVLAMPQYPSTANHRVVVLECRNKVVNGTGYVYWYYQLSDK